MNNYTQLPLPLPDTTIEIPLTKGYVTIVDAVDADLAGYSWTASIRKNSVRADRLSHYKRKTIHHFMHREILTRMLGRELLHGEIVDHIDGNSLNNRRSNLRIASHTQNMQNSKKPRTGKNPYKGAYYRNDKWFSQIRVNKKTVWLGIFNTAEEAHYAYCKAAIKYHGEYARFE